ncbi:hypothetical protein ABID59_005062 [Bradyrhizobium sp. S3.3.6]|uniref:hypothetical protein n=1 Tax=Bradyrhizobium sp. S3.3.6 TaxID=3156429 RepID=UPI003398CA1C
MAGARRGKVKRLAYGRFNEFIQAQEPAVGTLPLIHISRGYVFDAIVRGDFLTPQLCEIFQKKLTYTFYGRPAYRAKDGNNARMEFEWPIIFVLDPTKVGSLYRIFPFDTGAYALGLYKPFFDPRSDILDFALAPSIESARKLVGTCYLSHEEYYCGYSRKNIEIPIRQFEIQGVAELSRLPGVQNGALGTRVRDERSSAIEVQINKPISLKESLLAIVLPAPYMGDPLTQAALARWGVTEVHDYSTLHNMGGEAWIGQVYQIVDQVLKRLGFLK